MKIDLKLSAKSQATLVAVFSLLLSLKLFIFIRKNAVNLLFSDHWTYLKPMFEESGAWARFFYQHGPHRQGLGFLISGWLMELSNWNTNIDSYFMGFVLIFSNVFALWLAKCLRGRIVIADIIFPVLILSPLHYETILLAPNSSHSIVPFILIIISCFGFVIRSPFYSGVYLVLMAFLLLFTGFGFFAGLLLILFLILKSLYFIAQKINPILNTSILVASLASLILYYSNYNIQFATYDFSLKPPTNYQYLEFISYLWAGIFQVRPPYAFLFGFFIFAMISIAIVVVIEKSWTAKTLENTIPVYLMITSLVYSIAVATGRIETGANFAQGSRYMLLAVPAIFGLYLYFTSLSRNWSQVLSLCVFALACLNHFTIDKTHKEVLEGFQSMKRNFLASYSPKKSLDQTERDSGVLLLGGTEERFHWLQERGIHFAVPIKERK